MKQKVRRFVHFGLLAAGFSLLWLLTACALLSSPEPQDTPTSAAPAATATANNAAATTAPAIPATSTAASNSAPTAASTSAASSGGVPTVTLELVPGDNTATFRVREQLARLSFPSDAIGSTKNFTGTIVARSDGTIVAPDSKFQVDLSTLKSDEGQRDNFIKQNTLQTNRYRYATFVPTAIEGLSLPPKDGPVSFKLIGDLTLRNVTKQVTWDVTGTVSGNEATGTATTSFTWDYFNLSKPSVFTVLSVEDTIKLELSLHLRRVALQ